MTAALLLLLAAPDLSGMLKLSSAGNRGHACPISMSQALTNAHIASSAGQWVWGVGDGELEHGLTTTDWNDGPMRDLASMSPATPRRFPRWYPIAERAPKVGDRIYFLGYDWRDKKRGFGERAFEGKVTRIQNGELIYDKQGVGGSSGSCVLNEAGEVVAINKSGKDMDNGDETGQGIGVWGDWLRLNQRAEAETEQPSYAANEATQE